MTIKTVLFDWDNTIIDTNSYKKLSRNAVIIGMQSEATERFRIKLSRKILEETMEKIRKEKGSNYNRLIEETAAIVCRNLNITDQLKIDRISAAGISAHHRTKSAYFAYLYNEVIETLATLRNRGIKIGIATAGLTLKQMDKINWANLDRLIDYIFVTEQYVREMGLEQIIDLKTKEYFLWIAAKLQLKPNEMIMIGDSYSNDIESSKDAGLITVHLNRKCGTDEVKGPKADHMVEDLSDILDIIVDINSKKE